MADQNNAPGHAICNRIAMQLEIGGWHDAAEYVRSAWMMSQIADLARADRAAPEGQVGALRSVVGHLLREHEHGCGPITDKQWASLRAAHALTPSPAVPTPACQQEAVLDILAEARSGLCAHAGGPDGACSETIKRIDAALRALKGGSNETQPAPKSSG